MNKKITYEIVKRERGIYLLQQVIEEHYEDRGGIKVYPIFIGSKKECMDKKEQLFELADHQLRLMHINAALIGWVECENENNFYANIKLLWKN